MSTYFRLLDIGAFAATVLLIFAAEEIIDTEQFEALYEPAIWACLKIPFFVIAHERWIDLLGGLRNGLRWMFVQQEF